MYYDFHLHTSFSSDSNAPMERMILQGISLGFPESALLNTWIWIFPRGIFLFL